MIPTYELDDNEWNRLVQDVADHFGEVILNRGFQYFKQGRVVKLTMPAHRVVKAMVEGGEYYHVKLDLNDFKASRCDCPVGSYCKHMFAAILKYADIHNRSVHALVNAKSAAKSTSPVSPARSYNQAKQEAAQKAAENYALLRQRISRIPEMSVSEWHEWFGLATERLMQSSRNTQFVNDALASIYKYKPALPQKVDALFILHAQLFVLSKLTKQPQDQSGYIYSYLAFHVHHAASDLQEKIGQRIANEASMAREPDSSDAVKQTLNYLRREMLAETNENHYFLYHYFNVWSSWVLPGLPSGDLESFCDGELFRLEETAKELDSSEFSLAMARVGMRLFQARDEDAWKLLDDGKNAFNIPHDLLLYFLSRLTQSEEWSRLAAWLTQVAPLLAGRRHNGIRPYAEIWELAIRHVPEAEPRMWSALVSLLPQSRAVYEEKLLARGQWERWMDLHLSLDSDPMDFRVTELAPLEKNAPEVLLPFYHQAVERYVLLKNRDSYKTAVRLLKRLAKLYKKLKREPRWEFFLSSFTERHNRLRALQEELRKGKLLP